MSDDTNMQPAVKVQSVRDKLLLMANNEYADAQELRAGMAAMAHELESALAHMANAAQAAEKQPEPQWTEQRVENMERELHRVSQPIKPPDTPGPHRVDC